MKISVFGLGFVGSVTASCLADRGHHVIGVDVDGARVDMLSRGFSPVREPEVDELVASGVRAGRLDATLDLEQAVAFSDISLICIGLRTDADGSQDLRPLEELIGRLGEAVARKGRFHSVVVRSTILPTTTRSRLLPVLERTAGRLGTDFGLAHHPEFMRESTAVADFRNVPRTIIGELDAVTGDVLAELYGPLSRSLFRTSPEMSEAAKYADNAWHALKVTFANEIGTICNACRIDGQVLMEMFCADTQLNISNAYLKPGFGFGGPCLSYDVRALARWGEDAGLTLPLLSNIDPSNRSHLQRSIDWLVGSNRRRLAVLGLAYKPGMDDLRASPFVHVVRALHTAGREVRAFDPAVSAGRQRPSQSSYLDGAEFDILLTDDLRGLMAWCDAVVICSYAAEHRAAFSMIGADKVVLDFARIAAGDAGEGAYHAFI